MTIWFGSVRAVSLARVAAASSCDGEVGVGPEPAPPLEAPEPRTAENPPVEFEPIDASNCGAASPPRLSFRWDDAPEPDDAASLATTSVTVTVSNDTPATLALSQIRAIGDASGVPFELIVVPAALALPGGATETLTVELAGLELARMRSAGAVEVFARAETEAGDLVEQGASPTLYFHPTPGGGLEVYGFDALRTDKRAGDVFAQVDAELITPATDRVVVLPTPNWSLDLEGDQP